MKKSTVIYRHILVWFIFISYELSFIYLAQGALRSFWDFALHYAVNIALLYFNAFGLNILYYKKNKYLGIALFMFFEIGIYLAIQYLLFLLLKYIGAIPNTVLGSLKLFFVQGIYRCIYFLGFSIAYWFALSNNRQRVIISDLTNSKLYQERLSAELGRDLLQAKTAYLQSQLNPHLLFNTLNFIYNSVRNLSESAAYSILLLAEMMRYSLANTNEEDKVTLQKEIDHINNMIKLNQLRFNEKLNLKFNFKGNFDDEQIIPLILLSFVENIYKHGDLTDANMPAQIDIECTDHVLIMNCVNKTRKNNFNKGWGIGIKNARTRLDIYYPEKHELIISETETQYNLKLMLKLQ